MKLKITIDGKQYEVEVEASEEERGQHNSGPYYYVPPSNPVSVAAPPPPPQAAGAAPSGNVSEDKVCRSPIAGIVVRIAAQTGQSIQANDPLIVVEAMKMETNITSPVSGKVKAIHAAVGDGVQINQVLVEFE